MVSIIADSDRYGSVALVFQVVAAVPSSLLAVGVVLGSIREFVRGRRDGW